MASASASARLVRGTLTAAGIASAAAAAGGSENRAAPQGSDEAELLLARSASSEDSWVLEEGPLNYAKEMIKDEMVSQGVLQRTHSADGTPWLDALADLDATLDLAAEVAADPAVQKTILAKSRDQALVLRLMREQPSLTSSFPCPAAGSSSSETLDASYVLPHAPPEAMSVASSSPTISPSLSAILAVENEALKAENAALKAALCGRPCPRPGVARLQAAVRGALTRRGFYDDDATAARLAPKAPTVRVSLVPAAPAEVQASGGRVVTLNLAVHRGVALRPAGAAKAAASALPRRAVPGRKAPISKDGVLLTVSVVVGILALVMMRNPQGARSAAAGAAATVAALMMRANQRMGQPAKAA